MVTDKNTVKQKKASFLAAYAKTLGNVSEACKAAGVSRAAYYNWIGKGAKPKLDKAFVEALAETDETRTDFVEGQQLKGIQGYLVDDVKVFLVEKTETKEVRGKVVITTTKEPLVVPIKKHIKQDTGLIKHYLQAQARARGYGKEIEVKLKGAVAIKTIVIREASGPSTPAAAE